MIVRRMIVVDVDTPDGMSEKFADGYINGIVDSINERGHSRARPAGYHRETRIVSVGTTAQGLEVRGAEPGSVVLLQDLRGRSEGPPFPGADEARRWDEAHGVLVVHPDVEPESGAAVHLRLVGRRWWEHFSRMMDPLAVGSKVGW